MRSFYPVFLSIEERNCLVIGGGKIATRKIESLIKDGGLVTVISPLISDKIQEYVQKKKIIWINKTYQLSDIEKSNALLLFAATDSKETNDQICLDAKANNILVNNVGDMRQSDFIIPARFQHDYLQIAVSTSGTNPLLAKQITAKLADIFPKIVEDIHAKNNSGKS